MASKAIPSHLKAQANGDGDAAEFARKHHGKTQSHVVSSFHSQLVSSCRRRSAGFGTPCLRQVIRSGQCIQRIWYDFWPPATWPKSERSDFSTALLANIELEEASISLRNEVCVLRHPALHSSLRATARTPHDLGSSFTKFGREPEPTPLEFETPVCSCKPMATAFVFASTTLAYPVFQRLPVQRSLLRLHETQWRQSRHM